MSSIFKDWPLHCNSLSLGLQSSLLVVMCNLQLPLVHVIARVPLLISGQVAMSGFYVFGELHEGHFSGPVAGMCFWYRSPLIGWTLSEDHKYFDVICRPQFLMAASFSIKSISAWWGVYCVCLSVFRQVYLYYV
jgi:hypothetical protein